MSHKLTTLRSSNNTPILVLGNLELVEEKPRELLDDVLPTFGDVIRAIHYAKQCEVEDVSSKIPWKTYELEVAKKVQEVWQKASVPTISFTGINKKVTALNQELLALWKTDSSRKCSATYMKKVDTFKVSMMNSENIGAHK